MITFADRLRGRGLIRRKRAGQKKGTGRRTERDTERRGHRTELDARKERDTEKDGTTGGAADKKDVISFCAALFF